GTMNILGGIFTGSNVLNITKGTLNIYGGTFIQNSIKLAMIKATNAIVTIGENSTSIFKAAWALDIIQGYLNIFGGIFTYKSIEHGMVTTTDAMVIIGRNLTPTMTGFNLFDILRGTIYILGGTFSKKSSLELNGTRISITDANATFGDYNDANITPIFNGIDVFNFSGGKIWFFNGKYNGIKSGFKIISFESQLTFDGKLRQPEFYQIQVIKQDHGQLNLLYGLFVGIPSGFRIQGFESYSTIGSTQTATFTNLKQIYQFKGTLNCVKFKFPGILIKNFTEFQIRTEEADVIIGSVDVPTNQITGMQQGKRSSTIYLHKCKTVTVQNVILANNTNNISGSSVIILITPVMYVEAYPDTKLTIADCVFQNNSYTGRGFMSGAVYVDFNQNKNQNSTQKGYIRFINTKFIANTGTISGAIMFQGTSNNSIIFSQVMFVGNSFMKEIYLTKPKASCVFTYNDLSKQFGNNPFASCYAPLDQKYIKYSSDLIYFNMQPFFYQQEGNRQILHLNTSYSNIYVSIFEIGDNIYPSFASAVDNLPNVGGTIILKDSSYTFQDGATLGKYVKLIINPYQGIPTLFNPGGQIIPFNVNIQGYLTISDFRIVQGVLQGDYYESNIFFFIGEQSEARLTKVDISTLYSNYIQRVSFIQLSSGSLIMRNSNFTGNSITSNIAIVNINDPVKILIKMNHFRNLLLSSGNQTALKLLYFSENNLKSITDRTFRENYQQTESYSSLGCTMYIQCSSSVHDKFNNISNNLFSNNTLNGGAIFLNYSLQQNTSTRKAILYGSTFYNNTHATPLHYSGLTSSYDLNDQFRSKGFFYYPLEIFNNANATDEIQEITSHQNKNNSDHFKFKTISGAVNYGNSFCNYLGKPLTIVDTYTCNGHDEITANNIILQGKRKLTDIKNQTLILSDNTSSSIFIIRGNNNTLRWLTFERNFGSTANILIEIISNSILSLNVDGCIFNDRSTESSSQHDFSFIQTSGSTTTIINSVFNGGKFGNGGAISQISGQLNVDKCIFNGIQGQTGPFIRSSSNGTNQITTNIFRNSQFSSENVFNHAAVIIDTINSCSLNLNIFAGLINGTALSIDSQQFNVIVNSNDFRNNSGESSPSGAIRITNNEAKGVLNAQYNQFINNSGTRAGAIFIDQSSESPQCKIQYNFFSNNTATSSEKLMSKANDILILAHILSQINDNYLSGGNRTNEHVQISGRNPINDPDSGIIIESVDNPLKTIDYAVNQKDRIYNLTVMLYRQTYSLQNPLWINDDIIYIKDEEQYQNEYENIEQSIINFTISSNNAFQIREGLLVLNKINIDVSSSVSPFVLVFITGQGSFEMNDASISMSSNNSKLIECIHAITSLKLLNIKPITATGLSQSSSLIDLILNSNSKFEICNTSITAPNNLRYITINLQDKPSNININKVQFNQLGQDNNAKVAQIYGTKIIPEQMFSLCSISDSTSFHPLQQISGEDYSGQYDNLLLKVKQTNQEQFYSLPTELFSSITVNNMITFIGTNSIFQITTSAQLNVVNQGHLTVHGVTFNQMAQGSSIITSSSANSFIILEDVCFQIAQKKNFESILEYLPSSRIRKDFTKLKNKYKQINYDYYLRSLDKTGTAQILANSFVNITFGYSLSLSNIKFGEWIVTDDIPLIDANGPLQHFLIENLQIKNVGRQYGGPYILNLNIYPSGEAKIKNVTVDGRGWVQLSNWRNGINNKNTQNVDFPNEFKWKYPAIKIKGGKLRVSDSKFVGLGVDGALVLEDLQAFITNSTHFKVNDVLNKAKQKGLNKNIIPSEQIFASGEEDSDKQIDEDDRQLKELHRYRVYTKNLLAYEKTTLKAHNVSFIGEKLSKKKKSFKEGYSLQIQHQSDVILTGEIGQSNNAFGIPEIKYVKTKYIQGVEKDIGNGKIEKIVQIEIRTKGKLILGVEWFLELQNKKDPEDNKRTLHYNLLHRKVWEEATNQENLEGWYLIENQNHVNIKKIITNSFPMNEFGDKIYIRWVSEKVILLRLTHIEPKPNEKSNLDKVIDPDSDRYIKDWQLRLGIEKRKDQQGFQTEPKIKWSPLGKHPLPVLAKILIIIGIVIFILIVTAIVLIITCPNPYKELIIGEQELIENEQ
ncbi:MAG: hypothetical protein EZS28_015912, partial [Streblomastix strix]